MELKFCATGSSGVLSRMRILRKRSLKRLLREVSFSFINVKNMASASGYAVKKIPRLVRMWKNALYLSINVFSTKVLIGGTIFYVSYWRRDHHFTWSSEPLESLAACSTKVVPSFLSYLKTLSIGPAPGIELATSRSAVTRFTEWANTAAFESSVVEILWLRC